MSAVVEVLQELSELVETAHRCFRFVAYPPNKLIVQTDRFVIRALQSIMLMLLSPHEFVLIFIDTILLQN